MIDLSMHGRTHGEVLALLGSERGLGATRYRIDILREGMCVGALDYLDCSLEMDGAAEVKYYGRLTAEKREGLDLRAAALQPVLFLDWEGERYDFAFPPLRPVTVGEHIQGDRVLWRIEAYDETVRLQENSVGELLYYPRGTLYTAAVEKLLHDHGFEMVNLVPSTLAMGEDREDWEESDDILAVANALLGEIGYGALTVDRDGVLVSGPVAESDGATRIRYAAGAGGVLRADKSLEADSYRRPNRFVGTVFTAEMEAPWRYEWVDTDPASPSSVPNLGYVRTEVLRFDNLADYATLRDKVHRHALEMAASCEYASLHTAILPHHGVGERIEVEAFGLSGVWEETGWRIDRFGPGGWMTHSVRKAVFG